MINQFKTVFNLINQIAMKTSIKIKLLGTLLLMVFVGSAFAQQPAIQYYRYNDKRGINVFETSKQDSVKFDGIKVRLGGDFAIQYQALSQENDADTFKELENNFNLPSANLNLDVQLADGIRLHMRTYLSSRHHNEGWVKGGYLQFDNLNIIKEGFLSGFMEMATIRFGYNDINYGDQHFRRSDNATVIYNPFVGNYILDAFTTEPFGELTIQKSGFLGVVGVTNGRLNQTTSRPYDGSGNMTEEDGGFAMYLKLGYDKQINEDFRLRVTGSMYNSTDKGTRDYLYAGDRAGSRYYEVYNTKTGGTSNNDFFPRYNPNYAYQRAFVINPFVKYKGLEFFGTYEQTKNGNSDVGGSYTQTGAEVVYRIGGMEQLFVGARLNNVSGELVDGAETSKIARQNFALGWFLGNSTVLKVEYVTEKRTGDGWVGTMYEGAKFNGFMVEAAISF